MRIFEPRERATRDVIFRVSAAAILFILLLVSFWIGQNTAVFLPVQADTTAPLVDGLFRFMLMVGAFIIFFVNLVLVYSGFAFRRAPEDQSDGPPIEGNTVVEIFWFGVPTALVLWLSITSFSVYQQLGVTAPMESGHTHTDISPRAADTSMTLTPNRSESPVQVQVTAQQWAWVFSYPYIGKNISTSELHLPVNREAQLEMRSKDVIHGFWVPAFRLKQDVIPGRTTTIRFTPSRVGLYDLECTQLCGTYHGAMRVLVYVETPEEHERWLSQMAGLPHPPTRVAQRPIPLP